MKQIIRGIESPASDFIPYGWMRFTRHTLDDADQIIKFELLVVHPKGNGVEYEWREFPGKYTTLTDIAPMHEYLLREKT